MTNAASNNEVLVYERATDGMLTHVGSGPSGDQADGVVPVPEPAAAPSR